MEKCQKKHRRKKKQKWSKNSRKTATERGKIPKVVGGNPSPWSLATIETRVTGFARKPTFPGYFRISRWLAPVSFQKFDFLSRNLSIFVNVMDPLPKSWDHHPILQKSPTDQPRKRIFCPTDREIDWIDVAGPLLSINVWSCTAIRHQSICGSIGDHLEKNYKRRGTARDSSNALATTYCS